MDRLGVFAVDFAIRLVLAEDGPPYARRHWYDVALIVLPMLRPMRLLRLLALARVLNRSATSSLVGNVSIYVVGSAVIAAGLGAVAVLDLEQHAEGANITTFDDALWWSATTVTTVGYSDHFPVTGQGRLIAVALMVISIAAVGAVTASVAAWLVRRVSAAEDQSQAASRRDIADLAAQVAALRSEIERTRPPATPDKARRGAAEEVDTEARPSDSSERPRRAKVGVETPVPWAGQVRSCGPTGRS
jgi:voltage-gated potassium channel